MEIHHVIVPVTVIVNLTVVIVKQTSGTIIKMRNCRNFSQTSAVTHYLIKTSVFGNGVLYDEIYIAAVGENPRIYLLRRYITRFFQFVFNLQILGICQKNFALAGFIMGTP